MFNLTPEHLKLYCQQQLTHDNSKNITDLTYTKLQLAHISLLTAAKRLSIKHKAIQNKKNQTLLCHELCFLEQSKLLFLNSLFTSGTDHNGDLNQTQGWAFQHSEIQLSHSAGGSRRFKASRRLHPQSQTTCTWRWGYLDPSKHQEPLTELLSEPLISQYVLQHNSSSPQLQSSSVQVRQHRWFYSWHLTFLLSVACANPQKSLTQLKHINLHECHDWQHSGRGTNQIVIMKFVTNNWVVTSTVTAT
jgi:hypothetical protein